jgi:hypothetical protein
MNWLEDLNKRTLFIYKNKDNPEEKVVADTETLTTYFELENFDPNPGTVFTVDKFVFRSEDEWAKRFFKLMAFIRRKVFAILKKEDKNLLTFEYAGFEPLSTGIMTKVVFEKNGRKAVKTQFGDGQQVIRSATKEAYYKGKGTDSVLTKGCREASDKVKEQITHGRAKMMHKELQLHAHQIKQRGKRR